MGCMQCPMCRQRLPKGLTPRKHADGSDVSTNRPWTPRVARSQRGAAATGAAALVNCASQEYFGAVDRSTLKIPVISPVFKERKNGKEKIVSFFAKRARGAMARRRRKMR